jgi:trigger factor
MQVSVETISTLERKVTVGVPAQRIDSAVDSRLQEVARTARIDGFRQGKVPLSVVRNRFAAGARQEVLGKVINDTFYEALIQQNLKPAGTPSIQELNDKPGQDFQYVATFEVYPSIELQDFSRLEVSRLKAEVTEKDIDDMIENLRTQRATFTEVKRAAKDGDQVTIDYTGSKDGVEFAGGKAEKQNLLLGSNSMIPGFEAGIIGMKAGDEKTIDVTFPADYHAEELKGAAVKFLIKVHSVAEKTLPELNDEFFKLFGVKEGGMEKFRREVRNNMERELKQAAENKLKQQTYDGLAKLHSFDVPNALIAAEVNAMRQNMVQQFGAGAKNLDLETLLPADMFKDQARQRVVIGLILNEIISSKNLKADAAKVRSKVEEMAAPYGDPAQFINYYYSNQQLLQQVESMVLEDEVLAQVLAGARVTDKAVSYQDVIKKDTAE